MTASTSALAPADRGANWARRHRVLEGWHRDRGRAQSEKGHEESTVAHVEPSQAHQVQHPREQDQAPEIDGDHPRRGHGACRRSISACMRPSATRSSVFAGYLRELKKLYIDCP